MTVIRYQAASPHRVAPSLPPPSSASGLGRANILIVDDDRLSANTLADMVRKEGHDPFIANTAAKLPIYDLVGKDTGRVSEPELFRLPVDL